RVVVAAGDRDGGGRDIGIGADAVLHLHRDVAIGGVERDSRVSVDVANLAQQVLVDGVGGRAGDRERGGILAADRQPVVGGDGVPGGGEVEKLERARLRIGDGGCQVGDVRADARRIGGIGVVDRRVDVADGDAGAVAGGVARRVVHPVGQIDAV